MCVTPHTVVCVCPDSACVYVHRLSSACVVSLCWCSPAIRVRADGSLRSKK